MHEIRFFPYYGPNRRSDKRVVEINLDFGSEHFSGVPWQASDIKKVLVNAGVLTAQEDYPEQALPDERMHWFSSLLAQTALLLQRKNGHRVGFFSVLVEPETNHFTALVEHEHTEVGMGAVKLALKLFSAGPQAFIHAYRSFSKFARDRALSLETAAIIECARQRDIPVFQLEREPLQGQIDIGYRIRPNGLLLLGHGAAGLTLDGIYCVERANERTSSLLRNLQQRLALLKRLGLPLIGSEMQDIASLHQFHLLMINRQFTALQELNGHRMKPVSGVHGSFREMCENISAEVGFMPLVISLKTADLSLPATETAFAIQDFKLAPDLGRFLGRCTDGARLMDEAANNLLDWLFPGGVTTHMPIIAVTGTNGKTTTCRMLNHIVQTAGKKPGLVCTDGIYLNGQRVSNNDASTPVGHSAILINKDADFAVLEAHHFGLAERGFAFDYCDVAICLNVSNDHLGLRNINTVEQMAEVKRSLLERARDAVVINADNPLTLAMLGHVNAEKKCLVSMETGVYELQGQHGEKRVCCCVLEWSEGEEWLVLYDEGGRIPITTTTQIPSSFNGTARFNICNAMHAAAASYFSGIGIDTIRVALGSFECSYETTPGRLNQFAGLPFRVVMDYAHNGDGFKNLAEHIDSQLVPGRKILMIYYNGDRRDSDIKAAATLVAGHFDHYVCRNAKVLRNSRHPDEVPALLKTGLISAGVSESTISVVPEAWQAVRHTLAMASAGDLVVLLACAAEFQAIWDLLSEMARTDHT